MVDFTATMAGLSPNHKYTAKTTMTLHVEGCPAVARARKSSSDYLNGWMMNDGRPVDFHDEVRDDEIALGIRNAGDRETDQYFGRDEAARAAHARLWIAEGRNTCGRCNPEAAVAAIFDTKEN